MFGVLFLFLFRILFPRKCGSNYLTHRWNHQIFAKEFQQKFGDVIFEWATSLVMLFSIQNSPTMFYLQIVYCVLQNVQKSKSPKNFVVIFSLELIEWSFATEFPKVPWNGQFIRRNLLVGSAVPYEGTKSSFVVCFDCAFDSNESVHSLHDFSLLCSVNLSSSWIDWSQNNQKIYSITQLWECKSNTRR